MGVFRKANWPSLRTLKISIKSMMQKIITSRMRNVWWRATCRKYKQQICITYGCMMGTSLPTKASPPRCRLTPCNVYVRSPLMQTFVAKSSAFIVVRREYSRRDGQILCYHDFYQARILSVCQQYLGRYLLMSGFLSKLLFSSHRLFLKGLLFFVISYFSCTLLL